MSSTNLLRIQPLVGRARRHNERLKDIAYIDGRLSGRMKLEKGGRALGSDVLVSFMIAGYSRARVTICSIYKTELGAGKIQAGII